MSHNIMEFDRTMSGRNLETWHGLSKLKGIITLDDLNETLGFPVIKEPLYLGTGEKTDSYATVRNIKGDDFNSDKKIILGHGLSESYKVLQNSELIEAIKPLVEADCAIETAGTLENGKVAWILLRLPSDLVVGKDDVINRYILASNDHAGRRAAKLGCVGTRVVCNNTLTIAENSNNSQLLSIRHQGDVYGNLISATEILDTVNGQFLAYGNKIKELTQKGFSTFQLKNYVKEVFEINLETEQEKLERIYRQIEDAFLHGPGSELETANGTAFGAYQAVNFYLNHDTKGDAEKRMSSLSWGAAKRTDARALQLVSA